MDLTNLKPASGSVKNKKRIGRGQGSGRGGTSTRGHKGQKSRSGYSKKVGFEGGQMPLQRRVPKFGFTNINRVEYKAVNLATIEKIAMESGHSTVDRNSLLEAGIISKKDKVKILGNGNITKVVTVIADAFSKSAADKIISLGGKVEIFEKK